MLISCYASHHMNTGYSDRGQNLIILAVSGNETWFQRRRFFQLKDFNNQLSILHLPITTPMHTDEKTRVVRPLFLRNGADSVEWRIARLGVIHAERIQNEN